MYSSTLKRKVKMIFKRVDHAEIVPRNAEETISFYVDILGFSIKQRKDIPVPPMKEVIFLELGDTVIEIISVDDPKPRSEEEWQVGCKGVALEVVDMSEAVNYLQEKGVALAWGPLELGDSVRAEIRDPDGIMIELREWK
jgi:glyoxylase I family protein